MADAYDPTTPADSALANTLGSEARAIKNAIVAGETVAANRATKFLRYSATGAATELAAPAANVATTSGATLPQLETNVNDIITALVNAGFMSP